VTGREGAKRVAIANAGTIPDRGLYGVFLAGADRPVRVGELTKEMVFENAGRRNVHPRRLDVARSRRSRTTACSSAGARRAGQDAVLARRSAGRPVELGYASASSSAICATPRRRRSIARAPARSRRLAAENLLRYLDDQAAAGAVPDDRTIVIERCLDELGDWRVCLLSPLGSRIHAPWAMAGTAHIRNRPAWTSR
jgi:ATP-dependent Lhr-like helicase